MSEDLKATRLKVLSAAKKGVTELIKVLESPILTQGEEDITADKMKNAASAKKLAFLDALEMLDVISKEEDKVDEKIFTVTDTSSQGFAELAAKNNKKGGR